MYHDQGLIPFKALSFGSGVNYTAGLGAVRTSPDHGTAFDIAGYLLVNNDPILWTMLNAIKEQQKEIEQLRGQVRRLRATSRKRR